MVAIEPDRNRLGVSRHLASFFFFAGLFHEFSRTPFGFTGLDFGFLWLNLVKPSKTQ